MTELYDVEPPLIDEAAFGALAEALLPEDLQQLKAALSLEAARLMAALRLAAAAGELAKIREIAHSIKGMAANMAAVRLSAIARRVELESPSIDDVASHLPALEQAIQETGKRLAS